MSLNGIIFILEFSVSVGTITANVLQLQEVGDFPAYRQAGEHKTVCHH
jgi:hypothetical protein